MIELDRKRYPDWSCANNANVMSNIRQAIERLVNHVYAALSKVELTS